MGKLNYTELLIDNLEETNLLATIISSHTIEGDIITLNGDLGTGKTAFAKSYITNLIESDEDVTSPTFNIQQIYSNNNDDVNIHHYDLYRLNSLEDAIEVGINDSLFNVTTIIEWPEIIEKIIPNNNVSGDRLDITISYTLPPHNKSDTERAIKLKGFGRWIELLPQIIEKFNDR